MSQTEGVGIARVFLVEDHPVVRSSLHDLLVESGGIRVVGEAAGYEEALRRFPEQGADVAIINLGLPDRSGLALIQRFKQMDPSLNMLVLSMHDECLYAVRALRAGARGYLMKTAEAGEIVDAVKRIAAGQRVVSERVRQQLLTQVMKDGADGKSVEQVLSTQELTVFESLGRGLATGQIARTLGVSEKTVGSYYERIKSKLTIAHMRDLARLAYDWISDREL
ncbi:MAG: response regulator transcription factor [Kiritimatiellae bacterium]|nr:response regulator transcription factor [Kiritimatiellia bacterium]